jgi:hypothetical protein
VRDRGEGLTWRRWLKWVVVVDLSRRLILEQVAKPGLTNDGATLRPCLSKRATGRLFAMCQADGDLNHTFIRQVVGVDSIIPAHFAQARQADLAPAGGPGADAGQLSGRALSPAGAH